MRSLQELEEFNEFIGDIESRLLPPRLKHPIIICHISDLHLGVLEATNASSGKNLPDKFIDFLKELPEEEKPHFLLISGDVISFGERSLYMGFSGFVSEIVAGKCLRHCDIYSPRERIIVVPGNHDVIWQGTKGTMEYFVGGCRSSGINSPFRSSRNDVPGEAAMFFDLGRDSGGPQPCAMYYYPEYRLIFLTMVSARTTNNLLTLHKSRIMDLIAKMRRDDSSKEREETRKEFKKQVKNMVDKSKGSVDWSYCEKVEKIIEQFKTNGVLDSWFRKTIFNVSLRLGLIHHHLTKDSCSESCPDEAENLRKTLWERKFRAVLHGHTHSVPGENNFYEKKVAPPLETREKGACGSYLMSLYLFPGPERSGWFPAIWLETKGFII